MKRSARESVRLLWRAALRWQEDAVDTSAEFIQVLRERPGGAGA